MTLQLRPESDVAVAPRASSEPRRWLRECFRTNAHGRRGSVTSVALLAALVGVAPGSSASSVPPSAVTFASSGASHYTVPPGVRVVNIVAVGGNGGQASSAPGSESPQGASLSVFLPVSPGEKLLIDVGANGTAGGPAAVGGGGAGGGGGSYPSGSGGGASDIRTSTSLASRLIVAAGAGGDPGGGNITDCSGWNFYGASADSYGQPGAPAVVKTKAGSIFPGFGTALSGQGLARGAGGGGAAAPGVGGAISPCTYPTGHTASGSVSGKAGAGANGGDGGASTTGAGSGAGGGGGYFGGGGGASGDAEVQPCAGSPCANTGGQGGAAGSSFVSASALSWAPVGHSPTSSPSVTIAPVIEISAPAGGAVFAVGQPVGVSWSCAGFLKASGQNTVCSSAVPSGGRLDTKSPGLHTFRVSDGAVVAAIEYAVAPSCGKLSAGALGRCQDQLSYFKAVVLCGEGRSGAACVAAAKRAYKQKLAKIK